MTLVVCSGGMDSVTLLHMLHDEGEKKLGAISFDYGQRHGSKELAMALMNADQLGIPWTLIDMKFLKSILSGSALTQRDIPVPEGHYADDNMAITVVPNRNMIMASIAAGAAITGGYDQIAMAIHAGDHAVYPDCRPAFAEQMNAVLFTATEGHWGAWVDKLYTPFIFKTKAEICEIGDSVGVDWNATWSCYWGEEIHCGRCGTCVERKEAFRLAQVIDPTEYKDPDFEFEAYRGA